MKLITQEVQEVLPVPFTFDDTIKHIEKIGRICYQSQDKITDESAEKFVKMLFNRGHWAMLEHSWLGFVTNPLTDYERSRTLELTNNWGKSFIQVFSASADSDKMVLCANWRAWHECIIGKSKNFDVFKDLPEYINGLFFEYDINLERLLLDGIDPRARAYTVIIKTDRSVTHELVRHRPCAFAQESQRYCAYRDELEFVVPYYFKDPNDANGAFFVWKELMERIEEDYKFSLKIGQKPQEARSMLPNCTATQIAITADAFQWEHIFKLRTAPDAYPGIKRLMTEIKQIFTDRGYI